VTEVVDVFTGHVLCWHPECQWQTPDGPSGIEAKYEDAEGRPVCWDHSVRAPEPEDDRR
jgi:hypothetical protein